MKAFIVNKDSLKSKTVMADRSKSIELLNKGVAKEIETVLQYLYFQFHFEDKGYTHLARMYKNIAIKEMMHIDMLSDRILFLRGDVIMKPQSDIIYLEKVNGRVDLDITKVLNISADMESKTVDVYNEFAKQCGELGDATSKRLFERLIEIEEEHQDAFEVESDNCTRFGETYLALQTIQREKGNDESGHEDIGME